MSLLLPKNQKNEEEYKCFVDQECERKEKKTTSNVRNILHLVKSFVSSFTLLNMQTYKIRVCVCVFLYTNKVK